MMLVQRLVRARARHRELRARLLREAQFLRPGLWITANPKMARHWRYGRPPAQLLRAKGTQLKQGLLRTFASLVWIRSNGTHTIFMPNAYKPDVVLVDPAARAVLRVLHSGPISQASIENRMRLSRHVDTPTFDVLDGGRLIREELVYGQDFAARSFGERGEAFKTLLAGYTSLCDHEGKGSALRLFHSAVEASEEVALPEALRSFFAAQANWVHPEVGRWPLVPSHGDMSAENIVLREGCPVLVDLEWADYFPFCYDPLWLVVREAAEGDRRDLLEGLLAGQFDTELKALWEAAGLRLPDNKVALLSAVVLLRAYYAATNAGITDPDRVGRYLQRWFPALQPATTSGAAQG